MSYFRLCPGCAAHTPADRLRCTCGALLTGVDVTEEPPPDAAKAPTLPPGTRTSPEPILCPSEDCAQPNPPGTVLCLYCNRPLRLASASEPSSAPQSGGVVSLPNALRRRFHIERQLPASGAEAELFIVRPLNEVGPLRVVKLYRHGIHPKPDIQARIAQIPDAHKVRGFESGLSEGFAYAVMEYCEAGSLRQWLQKEPVLSPSQLQNLIASLAAALRALHAQHVIHRDLKPENLLLRQQDPLEVVLTDFGIASIQDATLRFTSSARTLTYGAPETLAGILDTKVDYWAMGLIILECTQGEHPFAGLSDAVILHRLTTRSIDLGRVRDARLRMLLRGLLLRDPQARWGDAEVSRWLAGDPTQIEPIEQGGALGARQPYRLAEDDCFTADQLAVSLARHWSLAVSDLDNGQILRWLRQELADHNSVRILITLNEQTQLSADARLLRFLLHLAPGLPPVWRGHALSVGTVLTWARQTLKGHAASAELLLDVHRQGVIRAYAEAGHPELADLHQRWQRAVDAFEADWQAAQAILAHHHAQSEPASYDDVLYGQVSNGMRRPMPALLHARLLALSFDESWTQRLRQHLAPELQRLAPHVPWLADLGDAQHCRPPRLLVLHALLPEAQRWSTRASHDREAEIQQQRSDVQQFQRDNRQRLQDIRTATQQLVFFDPDTFNDLADTLRAHHQHAVHLRSLGWADEALQRLRQRLARQEVALRPLREDCHAWLERYTANRGWFSPWVGFATLMIMSFAANLFGGLGALGILMGALGGALWRVQPLWRLCTRLRQTGDNLPS